MITALDIVSVQALVYRGTERVRRALEIVEIIGIDPSTGNLRVNTVFVYDPVHDAFTYKGRSQVYTDIAEQRGWSRERLEAEIATRKSILLAMESQGIIDYVRASRVFQAYNINPEVVTGNLDDLSRVLE